MKGNHFWDEEKRRSFLKLARYCKISSRSEDSLCILTIVSYLYVYISNTAAGLKKQKLLERESCNIWINGSKIYFQTKIHTIIAGGTKWGKSIGQVCACLEQEVDKILVWSKKLKFVWYTEHLEAILCKHLVLTLPHIFSFIVIIEKT